MFKNILMPTDGSTHSERAVERGIELASLCGAKVIGIHVLPNHRLDMAFVEGVFAIPFEQQQVEKESHIRAANFLEFVEKTATAAGVQCQTVVITNDQPYDAIISAANEYGCDLIVMTSRCRHGLASLIMRSEPDRVLHRASIPVLTFRALVSADNADRAAYNSKEVIPNQSNNLQGELRP